MGDNPMFFRVVFIVSFVLEALVSMIIFRTLTSAVISVLWGVIVVVSSGIVINHLDIDRKTTMAQISSSIVFLVTVTLLLIYSLIKTI